MSAIAILLHIGQIISLGKDLEQAFKDLLAKKLTGADAAKVLNDLKGLLGLINIPGVSSEQISQVISDLEKSLGL